MAALDPAILDHLGEIVGTDRVLTDADSALRYGRDWTRVYDPLPSVVVLPGCISEVQAVVRLAAAKALAIVPSGGRTGLSAGAVASAGECVCVCVCVCFVSKLNLTEKLLSRYRSPFFQPF